MGKVYIVKHNYNHSGDSERDAFISEKDRKAVFENELINIKKVPLENTLRFQANFQALVKTDYPLTDLIIPIISKRFEKVIRKLKGDEYVLYPIVMFDDTYLGERFDKNGELKGEVPQIDIYSVIQLLRYHDLFDYDLSEYRMVRETPRLIKRFVLREPKDGFPPIFRISETPSDLFLSEEAINALETAGIKGCVFEEVEVSN